METLKEVIVSFFKAMSDIECTLFGKYTFSLWDMMFTGIILGIIGYFIFGLFDS